MKNIIFIGGIHGSGKGKIYEAITSELDIIYLIASEVLKWNELSTQEEKIVQNIAETQNRLITNLNKIIQHDKIYLLDGHFCLLNKKGVPEKVSLQTFMDINPMKLILVTAKPSTIKERLENRDTKGYEIKLIEDFQNLEINFAKEISKTLNIPFMTLNSEHLNIETLVKFLK